MVQCACLDGTTGWMDSQVRAAADVLQHQFTHSVGQVGNNAQQVGQAGPGGAPADTVTPADPPVGPDALHRRGVSPMNPCLAQLVRREWIPVTAWVQHAVVAGEWHNMLVSLVNGKT